MRERLSLRMVAEYAQEMGLDVDRYNPGDGPRYKVVELGQSYFSTDGLYRSSDLQCIEAFLRGWDAHLMRSPRR